MHLAVVIDSSYEQNQQVLSLPAANADGFLVHDHFFRAGVGYSVDRLEAQRDLPERLEAHFSSAQEPIESLLLYFSGYVAVRQGRSPALLLDGGRLRAFPLPRLFDLVERSAHNTLVFLDAAIVSDDERVPAQVIDEIGDAVPYGGGVNALFSARPMGFDSAFRPSRFTDLFLVVLEELTQNPPDAGPITASAAFAAMRSERATFARIPAAAHRVGLTDFVIFPARDADGSSGIWERAPAAFGPAPSFSAPPDASWPPTSIRPESQSGALPLPSFDDAAALTWTAPPTAGELGQKFPAPSGLPSFEMGSESAGELEPATPVPAEGTPVPTEPPAPQADGVQALERMASQLEAESPPGNVVPVLEELVRLDERNVSAWRRLVDLYTSAGDLDNAVRARCRLAEALGDGSEEQIGVLSAAVEVAARDLASVQRAVDITRTALATGPRALAVLEKAARVLAEASAWQELGFLYAAAIEQLGEGPEARDIARRLGLLARDELGDRQRALKWLAHAAALGATGGSLHRALAELYEENSQISAAAEHYRAAIRAEPLHAPTHENARRAFQRADALCSAEAAAAALVVLGEADEPTKQEVEAHRPDGLLPVKTGLDEQGWLDRLLYHERETELSELLAIVRRPALEARVAELTRKKRLTLDPERKLDPNTSTTTLARSLMWTARLLGMDPPDLYVFERTPRPMAAMPIGVPTTIVAKTLATGLTLPELSFLWGRHLAFFRPEHELLIYYSTGREIAALLLCSLVIGTNARERLAALDAETRRRAKALERALRDDERERLTDVARRFPTHGARSRVFDWARSVELAGGRAGLLACGDLILATELIKKHPLGGLVSEEDQIADLLGFATSEQYAELRRRIGIDMPKLAASY